MPNPSTEHRIRHESLAAFGPVEQAPVVTGYAWGGGECDPDHAECLAKKTLDPDTGNTRCWVKRATVGPQAGRFYNPQSLYHAGSGRMLERLGRGAYEFRLVPPEAFDLYLKFLTDGNPLNVRNAERIQ